jgi:hypothetical protein
MTAFYIFTFQGIWGKKGCSFWLNNNVAWFVTEEMYPQDIGKTPSASCQENAYKNCNPSIQKHVEKKMTRGKVQEQHLTIFLIASTRKAHNQHKKKSQSLS